MSCLSPARDDLATQIMIMFHVSSANVRLVQLTNNFTRDAHTLAQRTRTPLRPFTLEHIVHNSVQQHQIRRIDLHAVGVADALRGETRRLEAL